MTKNAYAIRDSKAEIFYPPFYQHTHGAAERDMKTLVNDKSSTIAKHPEDFDLWLLGSFDDNTGVFTALPTPTHLVKAVQLIDPVN